MNSVLRRTLRLNRTPKRNFGGSASSPEKQYQEVVAWKKYTAGMVVLSGLCTLYCVNIIMTHGHPPQTVTDIPYMKARNKAFPWGCSDCELFNQECWDKCRGKEVAEH